MPVALATLATDQIDLPAQDHEGQADRDDPGDRDLRAGCWPGCPSVAKDGAGEVKKTTSRAASRAARCCAAGCGARSTAWHAHGRRILMQAASSRSLLTVLAGEFPDDLAALHDEDPVGQRQHRLGLGGRTTTMPCRASRRPRTIRSTSSLAPTSMPRVGSLSSEHAGRMGRATWPAPPSAGCRPTARRAGRSTSGGRIRERRHLPAAMSRSRAGRSHRRRDAVEDRDRDVLVDRRVARTACARRLSGTKAMPAAWPAAVLRQPRQRRPPTVISPRSRAACRTGARQLELARAQEAVDAQHLARPHVERHVPEAPPRGQPLRVHHHRRVRLRGRA